MVVVVPIRKYSLHLTLFLVQLHSPSWPRDLRVVRPSVRWCHSSGDSSSFDWFWSHSCHILVLWQLVGVVVFVLSFSGGWVSRSWFWPAPRETGLLRCFVIFLWSSLEFCESPHKFIIFLSCPIGWEDSSLCLKIREMVIKRRLSSKRLSCSCCCCYSSGAI